MTATKIRGFAPLPPAVAEDVPVSEPIRLFHGTTLEAAEQIRTAGWQARDLLGTVEELAARHEVEVDAVIDDLRRYNRFMFVEADRGRVASFAPNYETAAGSWAQRAPEVEWDALWAIWRIKYSGETDLYHWNLDVPGQAWVAEQMAPHHELAVVEVALSIDNLLDLDATAGRERNPITPEILEILSFLPEVAVPLPFRPEVEVRIHHVERRVDWDVFAYWLGLTREEFIARDRAGAFGPSGEDHDGQPRWWPLSVVNAARAHADAGAHLGPS